MNDKHRTASIPLELFDSSENFFFILSFDGEILYANASALAYLDTHQKDFISLHPRRYEDEAASCFTVLREMTQHTSSIPLVSKHKREIPVKSTLYRGVYCDEEVVYCISVSVSEPDYAKNLEAVIEEKQILLDSIGTQVWYLTDEETYGAVNQAHASFVGKTKRELEGKNLFSLFPDEVALACRTGNCEVFTTGDILVSREWVPRADGKARLLDITKVPKRDINGSVKYVVCSAEDITEVHEIDLEQKKVHKILETVMHMTHQFFQSSIAYEVIPSAFQTLGTLLDVSRVYLFERDEPTMTFSHRLEWCASEETPQISNPELQKIPSERMDLFLPPLLQQKPFMAIISALADSYTKTDLAAQDILSILVLPLFVKGRLFGFVGFDECRYERYWSEQEISLLDLFVETLSVAIERQFREEEFPHRAY